MNTNKTNNGIAFSTTKVLLVSACLLSAATAFAAQSTFTWTGAVDNNLGNTNNWSPVTAARPSAAQNDILQFDGTAGGGGNLLLTNGPANGAVMDQNPGFIVNVLASQTGTITIVESNTFTGRFRMTGTNNFNLASGAGNFSFGNGTTANPLPVTLAGAGNGTVHRFTNYSATSTVTFDAEVYYVMGGGGSHTMALAGPGPYLLNSEVQNNNGSGFGLTVNGPGTVTVVGTPVPGITYTGTFNNTVVNGGTLVLKGAVGASPGPIGSGNSLQMNGGNLDNVTPGYSIPTANQIILSSNFTYVGSQNLDTGLGIVTNTANRVITVAANTLSLSGPVRGSSASLSKDGAGTLILSNALLYTGGTAVSNGLLQLGTGIPLPSGTAAAEGLVASGAGIFDLNGNGVTISSLNGSGTLDNVSAGGTLTVTVGDFDGSGTFSGVIKNTSGSIGLSKTGAGSLTLSGANTYSGGTAVGSGTVLVNNTSGSGTGSGAVTVSSGATFGGTGTVSGSVNWQAGSSGAFTVTTAAGSPPNTTPLTVSGSVTLNNNHITINVPGVIPLDVGTYTLMTYNTSGSSGTFATSGVSYTGVGISPGTSGTVSTSGGTVRLIVVSIINGTHATWTNTANGNWSVAANWTNALGNNAVPHLAGDLATLGAGTGFMTVTLDAAETVGGVVFTNANSFNVADAGNTLTFDNSGGGAVLSYTAGTSNAISSAVSLNDNLSVAMLPGAALTLSNVVSSTSPSKTVDVNGSGTLSLLANNTYGPSSGSVGTTLSGGVTAQLGNNGSLSTGDVGLANGTETVRALAPLTLANNFGLSSANMTLDSSNNNVTLSGVISGTGTLNKNGAATLTLGSANTFTNGINIAVGGAKLGNVSAIPGGAGTGNINMGTNTTLDLNGFSPTLNGINSSFLSATIDSTSGSAVTLTLGANDAFATYQGSIKNGVAGLALAKNGAGIQTVAGTNTFANGTTINAGTLRVGNGNTNFGVTGIAVGLGAGAVLDNGALEFNLFGTNTFTNVITGTGAVNVGNNNLTLILSNNANSYSGDVNVNNGSFWVKNLSAFGSGPKPTGIHVQNGTAGNSQLHLDTGVGNNVSIPANIDFWLSNQNGCLFNESGTNTILGNIWMPFGGGPPYVVVKSGFLTLAGGLADGGTFNNSRVLILGGPGNGLFSGVANDNGTNGSGGVMLGGISKVDAGTWTISGANTTAGTGAFTGQTVGLVVNGGTLVLSGSWSGSALAVGGTFTGTGSVSNMTVNAGSRFAPGVFGATGSFTVSNLLTFAGGTNYFGLNKSLVPANTVVTVGVIPGGGATANATAGSLILSNFGPALVGGDKFTLFSQLVTNGNNITVTGPAGFAYVNNLAVDGSVGVVNTQPTNMTSHLVGNQLTLSWPGDHKFWRLLAQTNPPAQGLGTNWAPVSGFDTTQTSYTTTIDPTAGTAFYRLVFP
jgi:autotransporter-associated beta strand protein